MNSKYLLDKLISIRQEVVEQKVKAARIDKQIFDLCQLIRAERMAGMEELITLESLASELNNVNPDCGCPIDNPSECTVPPSTDVEEQ